MKVFRSEENVSTNVDINQNLEYSEENDAFTLHDVNISIEAYERKSTINLEFNYLDILNLYEKFEKKVKYGEYLFTQLKEKKYPTEIINHILGEVQNIYLINENFLIERGFKFIYDCYLKKGGFEVDLKYYISKISEHFTFNPRYSSNKDKSLMLNRNAFRKTATIAIEVYGDRENNFNKSSLGRFTDPKTKIHQLVTKLFNLPYSYRRKKFPGFSESKKTNDAHFKSVNRLLKVDFETKTQVELKKILRRNIKFTLFDPRDDHLFKKDYA